MSERSASQNNQSLGSLKERFSGLTLETFSIELFNCFIFFKRYALRVKKVNKSLSGVELLIEIAHQNGSFLCIPASYIPVL